MGWLVPNRVHDDSGFLLGYIVECSILADAKFPDWLSVLPGWLQPDENLAVPGLDRRLVMKLLFHPVEKPPTIVRSYLPQVRSHVLGIFDLVHDRRRQPSFSAGRLHP